MTKQDWEEFKRLYNLVMNKIGDIAAESYNLKYKHKDYYADHIIDVDASGITFCLGHNWQDDEEHHIDINLILASNPLSIIKSEIEERERELAQHKLKKRELKEKEERIVYERLKAKYENG